MKLINQSFEILEQKDFTLKSIKQFIERCSRVCYKSESRITEDSYIKFVDNLIKSHHDRCLEFGTVHLKIYHKSFQNFVRFCVKHDCWNSSWIKYKKAKPGGTNMMYITTNYRYYLELCNACKQYNYFNISHYFTSEDNEYYPKRYTVHFITNRVTMDSFRTHVGLSHLGESTRYCNYSKDRFNNEIAFIVPSQVTTKCPNKDQEGPTLLDTMWSDACKKAEDYYLSLIKGGWTPQQARDVLPLGIKSELISCGFEDAWSNFFYRRCAKDAHPMAREIANLIFKEFCKRNYITSVNG